MSAKETAAIRAADQAVVPVTHVIKGEALQGRQVEFTLSSGMRFATPSHDINSLVWHRREQGPAFNVPLDEIMDLLVATGGRMQRDPDGYMAEALERMARTCTLERRIVENCYEELPLMFTSRAGMEFMIEQELGGRDVLEGWREVRHPGGRRVRIRAFPPRILHVLAGNVPAVAAGSILNAALTKGVHLLKLPSNDLFTGPAILRTMAAVAPGHPVVRSFSAVYWRGGDAEIESRICRPQFFDKIVAWGGESAIRGIKQYAGPGLELVTFDPKTSISFIGREAFANEETLAEVSELAAIDASQFNQAACACARIQFVEGDLDQVDRFCAALQRNLTKERRTTSATCQKVPGELREEISALRDMEPEYRVWGNFEGAGLVIRSNQPVEFHPDGKIVNVVRVQSLQDAIQYATVATATVGVYPFERKTEVRDGLASCGAQRVVNLGDALHLQPGTPHDGFWAFNRYMRWITDEG